MWLLFQLNMHQASFLSLRNPSRYLFWAENEFCVKFINHTALFSIFTQRISFVKNMEQVLQVNIGILESVSILSLQSLTLETFFLTVWTTYWTFFICLSSTFTSIIHWLFTAYSNNNDITGINRQIGDH